MCYIRGMKKGFLLSLLMILTLPLAGCFGDDSSSSNSSSSETSMEDKGRIELFRKEDARVKDDTYILHMTEFDIRLYNRDGSLNENVSRTMVNWKIGDSSIASVDSAGDVTPKKAGETTLTAYSGSYSTTIDIKTAIFTSKFEYDTAIVDYKIGTNYDMPIKMDKTNATVFYTVEGNEDNIIVITGNRFLCKKAGTVSIHAEAYTSTWGDKSSLDFDIEVKDKHAPYFKYKNNVKTSGEGEVPMNKYSSIPYNSLGIYAYSYDDRDISNDIQVQSGTYRLDSVGTYKVILSITDEAYNVSSLFELTLTVTEFEIKKKKSPIDAITYDRASYELIKESEYSLAVNKIKFSMTVHLGDDYDTSDGTVIMLIYFKIKKWSQSRWIDYTEEGIKLTESFVYNGSRTIEFEYTCSLGTSCDPDTFQEYSMLPVFSGYVYNFIYY